jgi:hypothetical protein
LVAPLDPEFGVDVAQVVLDGLGCDEQLSSYLGVGHPLLDQVGDLGFPVGHLQNGAPFGVLLTQPAGGQLLFGPGDERSVAIQQASEACCGTGEGRCYPVAGSSPGGIQGWPLNRPGSFTSVIPRLA